MSLINFEAQKNKKNDPCKSVCNERPGRITGTL